MKTDRFLKAAGVALIVCAAMGLLAVAREAHAELERLVGNAGETIGYVHRQGRKTFVRDRCFRTMGYTTESGTFTDTGIRKARSPLPYMLLTSPRNCAMPSAFR